MTRFRALAHLAVGFVEAALLIILIAAIVNSCVNRCSRNESRMEAGPVVQDIPFRR